MAETTLMQDVARITMDVAQAAMNSAMAQKRAAMKEYGEARDDASDIRERDIRKVDAIFEAAMIAAKITRDAALEVARKMEVEANKLVRKASVAEAKAAAEAKPADPDGLGGIKP